MSFLFTPLIFHYEAIDTPLAIIITIAEKYFFDISLFSTLPVTHFRHTSRRAPELYFASVSFH